MTDRRRGGSRGSCSKYHAGKKTYNSPAAARRALQNIRDYGRRTDGGKPVRAYPCPICGRHYLTSQPQ